MLTFRFSLEFNKVISTQLDQDLVSFPNPLALESEAENLSTQHPKQWGGGYLVSFPNPLAPGHPDTCQLGNPTRVTPHFR